ncbi:hypothetical protein [Paenibacillus hemerocallicola]|uniref:hypothetical protein n=1 Tax=Paenibacillus hemerocallicola TaxID=1172614 RepID=UPI00159ED82F|nr:hypothetical protein [Paenibacillus hemerocallicola]
MKPRYLDYATTGNLIIPMLFLDSEQYMQLIDDCEAGKLEMKQKLRTKKRGA